MDDGRNVFASRNDFADGTIHREGRPIVAPDIRRITGRPDSAALGFMLPRDERQGDRSGKIVKFEAQKSSAEWGNARSTKKKSLHTDNRPRV